MPIPLSTLRSEGLTEAATLAKSIRTRKAGQKTAFLCHSHLDATYVNGLLGMLRENEWDVYVDWQDATLPEVPSRVTATKIQQRIEAADYFLFLATPNALASRWCPWEIGYADGVRALETIFVVATSDGSTTYGSEYLELYRNIDVSSKGFLGVWAPGTETDGKRLSVL